MQASVLTRFLLCFFTLPVLFHTAASVAAVANSATPGLSAKVPNQKPESVWTIPLVATGQIASIAAVNDPTASTEFLVDPFSAVIAPADGVLVYKGPHMGFAGCIVLNHGGGTYSLLLSSSEWDSPIYGGKVNGVVRKGEFLANAGGGANVQIPVTWMVMTGVDPGIGRIMDFENFIQAKLGESVGVKSVVDLLDKITSAQAVNTKALTNTGVVQFQAEPGLNIDRIDKLMLGGQELPKTLLLSNAFLIPAGSHEVSVSSGFFLKTVLRNTVAVTATGTSVELLRRKSNGDIEATQSGFIPGLRNSVTTILAPSLDSLFQSQGAYPVALPEEPASVMNSAQATTQAEQDKVMAEREKQESQAREQERLAQEAARAREQERRAQEAARAREQERLAQEAARAREQERLAQEAARAREQERLAQEQMASKLRRRALVIGNDRYSEVSRLENAGADAQSMAQALSELGFGVSQHTNLSEKGMKEALRNFRMSLQGGEDVVIFFAGHGVQIGQSNYLLPTDIKGNNEEQVRDDAIPLQKILDDMQDRRAGFTLAIIDACRDNPFRLASRSFGTRGLAPTSAASGQMVIFSAGAGQQALDKVGPSDSNRNGLFTRLFLQEMRKPGLPVDRILRNVRTEVARIAKTVGHEQTPAVYDQTIGDFFFKP